MLIPLRKFEMEIIGIFYQTIRINPNNPIIYIDKD